jgi:hypothetical protein
MRRSPLLVALLFAMAAPSAGHAEMPVIASDLRSPESAAWHATSSSWFVSNMGGISFDLGPDAGSGFITRVPQVGTVETKWLGGLERPRGVAANATHLFVALGPGPGTPDGSVAVIHILNRQVVRRVAVPGANADLNDVLVDPVTGAVYVSAPSVGAIFLIRTPLSVAAYSEVFVQDELLTQPNGLAFQDNYLVSAGLGLNNPGGKGGMIMKIDRTTKAITPVTDDGLGLLDGLVTDGDDLLVTEYTTGNLYRVARDGTVALAHKLAPGAADLGIDPARRVIMVPETLLNAVVVLPLVV